MCNTSNTSNLQIEQKEKEIRETERLADVSLVAIYFNPKGVTGELSAVNINKMDNLIA